MRIAVINDIHASQTRRSDRLPSDQALTNLAQTISYIATYQPDYVIVLGDLVQNLDPDHDGQIIDQVLELFQPIAAQCYITSGNHEGRGIGLSQLSTLLKKHGFRDQLYGLVQETDQAFIYLSTSETRATGERHDFLPENQAQWLTHTLNTLSTPTLLFAHHYLLPTPHRHNFYIEVSGTNYSTIKNGALIEPALVANRKKIKVLISGHSHWFTFDQTTIIPTVGLPAYSENIVSDIQADLHPQSWTLIDWTDQQLKVNVFSGPRYSWGQIVV